MAKIISQMMVFDYIDIEKLGDLERLQLALEGIGDEELMKKLEDKRGHGRDDYPVRVMWNLYVAMKVFGHRTVASFRRELDRNSQLRKMCGLSDFSRKKHIVPPARVFTNFLNLLETVQDEIDQIFAAEVNTLHELLPEFGVNLAGDGKYLDSYANRPSKGSNPNAGNRAENDAEFSKKEYHYTGSDGKEHTKTETHFGFKAHLICDVSTELPVAYEVTTANMDERKAVLLLLPKISETQKAAAQTLALDRGYDSKELIVSVKNLGICPIVDIRNCWKDGEKTRQYKDTDIVYNYKGEPSIADDKGVLHRMRYKGYDKTKNCLRYEYEGKIYKICVNYDERVFLPIARDSKKFERLYNGRTSVERLNGRLDRDLMFEDHCIRGLRKMKLMVGLSLIVMNGMAIGKIKRGIKKGLAAHTRIGIAESDKEAA
jgi:hypothetical protein